MPPFLALLPGLLQAGFGFGQLIGGAGMRVTRPDYKIPQATTDQLNLAQTNLNARSAAAAYGQDNIFQNQATTIQNAQQAGGGFAGQQLAVAQAQANTNRALEGLTAGEREDYQRRLGILSSAQNNMAQAQDRAFEFNQMQPFQDRAATRSALMEGGIQNIFGSMPFFVRGANGMNGMNNGQFQQPSMPNPFLQPSTPAFMGPTQRPNPYSTYG